MEFKAEVCNVPWKWRDSSFKSFNNTRDKKGIITYNPKHGIKKMKKHMENESATNLTQYKSKVATIKRFRDGCKKVKKCKIIPLLAITTFFGFQKAYHN
jgi:hypothetical protein